MDKVNHLLERDKVLKAIEKSLQCPICLGTLTSPLVMCCNNHCVCSSCGKDLTKCPTCRMEMANNVKYPILLDNILYEIPRKCELSEYCKEVMTGPELKEHKTICPYRSISCEIVSCSWKGEFKTLLEHVKINHKDFLLENGKNMATFTDFSIDKPYYSVKIMACQ
uniref:RING-type domain-containing protein n=1 Tax=Clastoptera arizonana TaxID=38151 RepID=A0A1B6EH24_9HEMI